MQDSLPTDQPKQIARGRRQRHLLAATALLLFAAFFRLWNLGSTPPGLSAVELTNAQLADRMRDGDVSVIYDQVTPAREGLYYAYLAVTTAVTGRGIILWRLSSVWLAMLSLAVMARLMRRLFGTRVALMTLGLMSVAFWPVWMGRAVLHVTLMPLVTSMAILTFVRAFQSEELTNASLWFTVGGLVLGLAQYVHVTAWTLALLFIAFVAYRWLADRRTLKRYWGNIVYTLALMAILNLPLLIFLSRHPGAREPVPVAEQPRLLAEIPERVISSIAALALRGDMLPDHNLPGRPVMGPVIAVLMVIGIGVAVARWRRSSYGLALLWLAIGLLPTAFLPHKPDFEFMAVILPVVFVFPAIGLRAIFKALTRWLRDVPQLLAAAAVSGLVGVLILGNAVLTYRDYFMIWPEKGDVRLAYQADLGMLARYLDTNDDPTPVSVCSFPADRSRDPFALSNRELLAYLMHHRDRSIRYFDCTQSLILAKGGESQRLIFPRGHYYDHLPGPLLAWMRYARDEGVPGVRPDVVMRLDASNVLADRAGAFITTAPTAWPPESGDIRLAELPVTFGNNIAFLGYTVRDDTLRPTDWIELTTYWRLDGPPPPDLTLFAHMLSNPVLVIAQADGLGVHVSGLQPRDVFLQYSMIQTPGGMAPGSYPLSVGMYFPDTGARLPILAGGSVRADRLFLQSIEVQP
jgi:4-amino-4-deoxy-L-arabinose transferase-like glycosyltransferase